MSKVYEFNSIEQLIKHMSNIVNKTVHHYKTDFTEYDVPFFCTHNFNSDTITEIVWVVRDCGTHIVKFYNEFTDNQFVNMDRHTMNDNSNEYLNAIRNTWNDRKEYQIYFNSNHQAWFMQKIG